MQADNRFCRNCPHHRDGHIAGRNWNKMKHSTDYRTCYSSNDSYYDIPCNCKEYVPKDNLEYLEWCVENKRSQYETAKR